MPVSNGLTDVDPRLYWRLSRTDKARVSKGQPPWFPMLPARPKQGPQGGKPRSEQSELSPRISSPVSGREGLTGCPPPSSSYGLSIPSNHPRKEPLSALHPERSTRRLLILRTRSPLTTTGTGVSGQSASREAGGLGNGTLRGGVRPQAVNNVSRNRLVSPVRVARKRGLSLCTSGYFFRSYAGTGHAVMRDGGVVRDLRLA